MSSVLWQKVPEPVREVVATLRSAGHEAVLVGGCVRALVRGMPVHDWDVATAARPEAVLDCFARAVPIGLRFGTVMVPTRAGPVDVTRFRGDGTLAGDLALRDFTINAAALGDELMDPFGGLPDLEARRLRAVGSPEARLAEDPVRALRAARFVAELGLEPEAGLVQALPGAAGALGRVAAERIRSELERTLPAPRAGRGVALLRDAGLEALLLPGAAPDAAAVIDALPPDLTLRWAAWLRGTEAERLLRRWRVSRTRAREVVGILALHPIDERVALRDASLRRALGRLGAENLERLFVLREAELGTGSAPEEARGRVEALRGSLVRLQARGVLALTRGDLAMDGNAVMAALGCGPGPRVGRALHHLTECVLDDPSCNTPEDLARRLAAWASTSG